MAKLKTVTEAELKLIDDSSFELTQNILDMSRRIEAGYCDPLTKPMALARSYLSLSRAAADLAANLLSKAGLQELEREADALRARKG